MGTLRIRQRRVLGAVIFDLDGDITIGETNRQFRDAIKQIVNDMNREVILNLAKVTKIDSSGFGEILAAYGTLKASRGRLKLMKLHESVVDLMMVTKLLTAFDVYNDERTAVEGFEADRERITAEIPISDGLITREFPEGFGHE